MSILRALVAVDTSPEDPQLSFSELKRRAGVDDTGQFNYHLGELVGTLVVKTDDGYRLSKFARRVLRPMTTGFYDPELSIEAVDIPGTCPRCNGALSVTLRENVLQVVCEADHVVNHGLVASPGLVVEHQPDDAATALGLLTTHAVELATAGVCPKCHGHTEGAIEPHDTLDCHLFRAPCDTCGNRFMVPVGGCVITHPDVVSLYAGHGIDIRRTVPWTHPFRQAGAEEVVSRDPFRAGLLVGGDLPGESLYVTVDRTATVQSIHRTPS
ncbi:MAG: hypothetical protein ABEH77_03380 [Halobacteriaceae archaeon]